MKGKKRQAAGSDHHRCAVRRRSVVKTKRMNLELTKDELTIMKYVIPRNPVGDPLKDTYELGDDEPDDPYAVLRSLYRKVNKLRWP
jgi:hypothetical protein